MARNPGEALLYSANIGCLEGVKAALKAGADIDYTQHDNVITGRGTALFAAFVFGHVDVVRLLLRKGASVWKRTDGTLSSPLHVRASRGHTEVVELLVHHGATLDIRDGMQVTPLMTACIYKQVDTARRLIELGARVDLADRFGRTPQRYCELDLLPRGGECARRELLKLIQEALQTKRLQNQFQNQRRYSKTVCSSGILGSYPFQRYQTFAS
ncbi:ankyrin repeat domain-containing protein 66-like [Branchiostoma floridae x Branchiostoma belcheri]